jgi:hypothetical protein
MSGLRFGEHVRGLIFDAADVADFHFEFFGGKLFEWGVELEFAAEFERGGEGEFVEFRIGFGEIEEDVAEIVAEFVGDTNRPGGSLAVPWLQFELWEEEAGVAEGGWGLEPFWAEKPLQEFLGGGDEAFLGDEVEVFETGSAFDHFGDLVGSVFGLVLPEGKGAAANESFGMGNAFGGDAAVGEDFVGLFQVALGADVGEAGFDFDEAGDDGIGIVANAQGAAVGEDFGVELVFARGLFVGAGGTRIRRDGADEAIGNVEFAGVAMPKVIMGEFVAEDGFEFVSVEEGEDRAAENDVGLAGDVEDGGVEVGIVLGLVKGDGDVEVETGFGFGEGGVEFGVGFGVEAVGGFEKLEAEVFGVVGLGLGGGEPVPKFAFGGFQVVADFEMVRERVQGRCGGRRSRSLVVPVLGRAGSWGCLRLVHVGI